MQSFRQTVARAVNPVLGNRSPGFSYRHSRCFTSRFARTDGQACAVSAFGLAAPCAPCASTNVPQCRLGMASAPVSCQTPIVNAHSSSAWHCKGLYGSSTTKRRYKRHDAGRTRQPWSCSWPFGLCFVCAATGLADTIAGRSEPKGAVQSARDKFDSAKATGKKEAVDEMRCR